jgi:cell division protein FtsB
MKLTSLALGILLLALQYKLWFEEGNLIQAWQLKHVLSAQVQENNLLRDRNRALAAEVKDLKHGVAAIEERARWDLGMVKRGEAFYQVIE